MSFWDLSTGDTAATGEREFEGGGGNFDPIPNNSNLLALIDEAKWAEDEMGHDFISLRWAVVAPDEFKNRKIFQKLWVKDSDPRAKDADAAARKRDKALRMLAAIDANCGGKLAKITGKPDDDDLTFALSNKMMVIKVMIWTMKNDQGEENSGNWISGVFAKTKELSVGASAPPKASGARQSSAAPKTAPKSSSEIDDEIPF